MSGFGIPQPYRLAKSGKLSSFADETNPLCSEQ